MKINYPERECLHLRIEKWKTCRTGGVRTDAGRHWFLATWTLSGDCGAISETIRLMGDERLRLFED